LGGASFHAFQKFHDSYPDNPDTKAQNLEVLYYFMDSFFHYSSRYFDRNELGS